MAVHLIIFLKLMTNRFSPFFESYKISTLVLVATSAKVDGATSGEYAAALHKFFQVSKVGVSLSYMF